MIKIITNKKGKIIPMSEMKPLQIGKIVSSPSSSYCGNIVMRTASDDNFEVMDLQNAGKNKCWIISNGVTNIEVYLCDEPVTITIEN